MNPKVVLEDLLSRKSRKERTANLTLLNKICEAQAAGARDFSLASIGKLFEAAGGLKARALYNKASSDYQLLIDAWKTHAPRQPQAKEQPEEQLEDAIVARIADPALRSAVLHLVADRKRIRGELDLLKSVSLFTIDRRPKAIGDNTPQAPALPQPGEFRLTPTERRALEAASSPEFLAREGWVAGQHGDVLKNNGRMLFDIGYLRAIQKALALDAGANPQ